MDLTGTLGNITRNQTGREMESVLLLMAIYLTAVAEHLCRGQLVQQFRQAEGALI